MGPRNGEHIFAVGDRVIGIAEADGNDIRGCVGTIVSVGRLYGVAFDDKPPYGHDLGGRCENGYGWGCRAESLAPYNEPVEYADANIADVMEMLR